MNSSTDIKQKVGHQWDPDQLASWAGKRLLKIYELYKIDQLSEDQAIGQLYTLLEQIAYLGTVEAGVDFPTLFSRLAYMKSSHNIHGKVLYGAQSFRKQYEQKREDWTPKQLVQIGFWTNDQLIAHLWETDLHLEELNESVPPMISRERKILAFEHLIKGVVLSVDTSLKEFSFLREDSPGEIQTVAYNIADRNEIFTKNIEDLDRQANFPVHVHLWEVEVDQEGKYHPKAFIIEPDFLVDVTAIASCFGQKPVDILPYILRKFTPTDPSPALLKGNIANYILDQLLQDPNATFDKIFARTFHLFPVDYAGLSNEEMRQVLDDSKAFYLVIRKVVKESFGQMGIRAEDCAIEPSFYQPELGLQGRLDVLHFGQDGESSHIIELKSGSTFMPNKYGLNKDHYVQTLLYDLLVRYAIPGSSVLSYILYCKEYERPLRNAPVAQEQQLEALQIRNRIILWERYVSHMKGSQEDIKFFLSLKPKNFDVFGYLKSDLVQFEKVFHPLTPLEKKYFAVFTGFLAREYHLSKVGAHHSDRNFGLAAVWRESQKQKSGRFALLNDLEVEESHIEEDHTLLFKRTSETDPLANFRTGDIAILYPEQQRSEPARGEIFKCSLVHINETHVQVRLRNVQVDESKFNRGSKWSLEHDVYDSSFHRSFQNLFLWACSSPERRSLFMGLKPPSHRKIEELEWAPHLTEEQKSILNKMRSAEDYFLLWGPPGTGKTSIMLKEYVRSLIRQGSRKVMLMAYTNRAVDEICEALESVQSELSFNYLRIGSRYGTHPDYKSKLLQEKVKNVGSREELREMLKEHEVFVSTVASFSGKSNLLKLVSFDELIIDEASQLLEPMMGNLIYHFPKIVMIGDHLQLPAVVQQSESNAVVDDQELNAVGVDSLGNSMFERLYKNARAKGWNWTYDILSMQGRMHSDILEFPSEHFYGNELRCLDHIPELRNRLFDAPDVNTLSRDELGALGLYRMMYIPSEIDEMDKLGKTNVDEALKTVEIVRQFRELWKLNNWEWSENTLGVITPFRAQIAQIRKELWALKEAWTEDITVDTVERYQGGARDIIILSVCANNPSQWESIVSENSEGVDRKLNVAITRARSYFVLIGSEEMMRMNTTYKRLLEKCYSYKLK